MRKESEIRPYSVINGRNIQRALLGGLDQYRTRAEKKTMERVLINERCLLDRMDLIQKPLADVEVNPNLTIFLDGVDGMGGYADIYAKSEWQEPGTRIEMEQEKVIIGNHFSEILNPRYIESLRSESKPLVIVEGGAGPDLRTFGTVIDVLAAKAAELQEIPIQMVHVDISKRMAAITIAKARTSGIPEKLASLGLQIEIAICHADVFDVLEKVLDNSLTYALLPFGVLSFGLDGKNPPKIMEGVRDKLRSGGGTLATVYNTAWRSYTELLEHSVEQINLGRDSNEERIKIGDLNPFVIRILDGQMQVGGGLAFNCTTFTPEELIGLVESVDLILDSCSVTPQGWSYWPDGLLNTNVRGNVFPNGLPGTPPPHLMDKAKDIVLETVRKAGGNKIPSIMEKLSSAIPSGSEVLKASAPYITVAGHKATPPEEL